jgi:mycofactocin system glycosyltransferase
MRLSAEGARAIGDWAAPSPVGGSPARRALARRLLDAGILEPHPAPAAGALTVVVPVRDRPAQLARCLDAIRASSPGVPVIVVDDGSADPAALRAACGGRDATVVRHADSRGPAAARNTGLAACSTEYVAFVDSDVVVEAEWAERLLGHFADPSIAAVAPRVREFDPSRGLIAGYEARHSALDMGPRGGLVAPRRPTSYVPSTALVVRRSAVGDGFDESLHFGEDVDLVWRLCRAGWGVRYEPQVHVRHDHRLRLGAFVARRRLYARSIGALARRHPEALPAMLVSPSMAAPWALGLAGRRRAALAVAALDVVVLGFKLRGRCDQPYRLGGALVARGLISSGLGIAHAVRRAWAPPLLVLGLRRAAARRLLLVAFAVPVVEDALAAREPGAVAGDAAMRLLDELVALGGTWEGCVRQRTLRPLLPAWQTPPTRPWRRPARSPGPPADA